MYLLCTATRSREIETPAKGSLAPRVAQCFASPESLETPFGSITIITTITCLCSSRLYRLYHCFVTYEYHCSQAVASPARIGLRKRMNAMYRQLDLKASANLAPSMLVRLLMDDSYKLILSLIVFVPTSMHIPKQTLYCDCCHTAHSTCRRQTHPCEEGSRDCKLGAFGISETKVALPFSTPLLLYAVHFCDMSSAPSACHCKSLQLQFLRSSEPSGESVWSTLQRWSKWTTCQEGPMKFRFRQIEQQPAPRLDVVHREGHCNLSN